MQHSFSNTANITDPAAHEELKNRSNGERKRLLPEPFTLNNCHREGSVSTNLKTTVPLSVWQKI